MELWELTARESIRDLVARYNANGDTGRFAQVLELFAEDAVMETPDEVYEGRDGIARLFTGTKDNVLGMKETGKPIYLRHNTSTHQIDLVGATHATGRCSCPTASTTGAATSTSTRCATAAGCSPSAR